jgi:Mor family transcriptional regulator
MRSLVLLLRLLYAGMALPLQPLTDNNPTKEDRNREIYQRHIEGACAVDLAAEYRISLQRVYIMIRRGKRTQW